MSRADVKFEQARALHQRGQLARARRLYEEVLAAQPRHPGALNLLGLLLGQSRQFSRAAALFAQAAEIEPHNIAAHNNRGMALQELEQWDAALASYEAAIRIKHDYAAAHFNRGNALARLGRRREALASLEQALALEPGLVEAQFARGNLLAELDRPEEALASYTEVLTRRPAYAEAHCNRGNVLAALRRWPDALASYDLAIAARPEYVEAHSNRGAVLESLERLDEALASYDRALLQKTDHAEAHYNRANLLKKMGRYPEALAGYDRALACRADFRNAHFNRGVLLQDERRWVEAIESYRRAIELDPGYAEAHSNLGNVYRELTEWGAALACYDRALALCPDFAEAHTNRGIVKLLCGDLETGWRDYEWRWRHVDTSTLALPRTFEQPRWSGVEPLAARSILVHNEQGYGDTLQFCRYVTLLSARGAHVVLEVPRPLVNLMASLEGVDRVVARGDALPSTDYQIALLSLPAAFGTRLETIPASARYLQADPAEVKMLATRLPERRGARVGLVWRGTTANKSIRLTELLAHLPPGFEYVSLQKDVSDTERDQLRHAQVQDVSLLLEDFGATAAVCECLDLILSVDTSVAHLAGALGRPVWILLMKSPDWRWLLEREDSPWYPTARLFRQTLLDDWRDALGRVGSALVTELGTKARSAGG